jgi:cell division septum initiation protein DivIVA
VDYGTGQLSPPGSESHTLYDATVVDPYLATLQAEMSALRTQLDEARRLADAAEHRMLEAQASRAATEQELARIQIDADRKVADAERQASQIAAAAERQADELLAATRMQAQGIIDEAHEAFKVVFAAAGESRRTDTSWGGDLAPPDRRQTPTNGASAPTNGTV